MRLRWMAGLALTCLAFALGAYSSALAQAGPTAAGSDTCLACHTRPDLQLVLEDGETLSLVVDATALADSVHGQQGVQCLDCHVDFEEFPHPPISAASRRDISLQLSLACQSCHPDPYERSLDSAHERARAAGNPQAAICTDCHGAHDTRRLTEPSSGALLPDARTWIPQTCARCHSAIYEKYQTSVHGSALVGDGNPDVPTCIDCHGVHNISDPTTAAFRLASPLLCSGCHTDPQLMERYDLSTEVLDTYVADFHGTTVTLFERLSPDAPTNKPVCFDCHGVHDIQRADDPERGLQLRENLLVRCQRCHPGASADFPAAWLSHYIPSQQHYPLVYTVDLFYKLFIPGTLGGMAVLVALDLSSRIRSRRRVRPAPAEPAPAAPAETPPTEAASPAAHAAGPSAAEDTSTPVQPPAVTDLPPADDASHAPDDSGQDVSHTQAEDEAGQERPHA